MSIKNILIWAFVTYKIVSATRMTDEEDSNLSREEKIILFDVVKFQNNPCQGNEKADNRVGTCYAPKECRDKNGTAAGECAQGYGVCCVFDLECGGHGKRENITHWISPEGASQLTGRCDSKICKLNDNVCQFRLDWTSFVIAGPSTATSTTHFTSYGVPVPAGSSSRRAQTSIGQCLKDTFNVRPSHGIKVPTVCGINTGTHMYIDASDASFDDCTTLSFNFKEPEPTRTWNVTIIQIPCDYGNKAPPGCLQYYFGLTNGDARGIIQSFNFAGGFHLADQNQFICIRREANRCAICYSQINNDDRQDFGISRGKRRVCTYFRNGRPGFQSACNQGLSLNMQRSETLMTHTGFIRGSFQNCGNYGYRGNGQDYDFIHVNKPVVAAELAGRIGEGFSDVLCGNGNLCGRDTPGPGVCSRSLPFNFRFVTDSSEGEFEHLSEAPNSRKSLPHGSKGFRLAYRQRDCRPSTDKECFQCNLLSKTTDQCLTFEEKSGDQTFANQRIKIRGFPNVFLSVELPAVETKGTVKLTKLNGEPTEFVLGVLGGSEGLKNNLDGTFLSSETLVANQASQIWYRSKEDANGCSFLRNCNCENCETSDTCETGKLFTFLQRSGTQRFEEGSSNFDGGFPVINSKSNTINNELSCFGPHVHPSGTNGFEFKIYQPFEGPSIPCDRESYTSETGTIKYPSSGNYEPNLNCFFRITVAEGKQVKITFLDTFDFANGTFIDDLRFSNIPKPTTNVTCSTGNTQASCGECPKPTSEDDGNCEDGGDCAVKEFITAFDPLTFVSSTEFFCTNKGVTIGTWCNGYGDFLQLDQKTMIDYNETGSPQNRYCGTSKSQRWMTNAQSANDPNAELISQDGTFSMTNIILPAEGATGPISVFRNAPFLGLSNDDTADGTEVIFEANDGSDSQTWKRTDRATGDCFTLKNDLSTTFLTLTSETGTLTACATCACATDAACQSDNDDAQCWKIASLPKLTNNLGFSIRNSGAEVGSFSIPASGQDATVEQTDNFLTVDVSDGALHQVVFTSEATFSDLQLWTRGTADSNGFFTLENQSTGELLTATATPEGVLTFKVQGSLLPSMYTSDRNEIILWMKTNEDTVVGNGFELQWETVDP